MSFITPAAVQHTPDEENYEIYPHPTQYKLTFNRTRQAIWLISKVTNILAIAALFPIIEENSMAYYSGQSRRYMITCIALGACIAVPIFNEEIATNITAQRMIHRSFTHL